MTVQEAAANALVDLELAADRIRGEAAIADDEAAWLVLCRLVVEADLARRRLEDLAAELRQSGEGDAA